MAYRLHVLPATRHISWKALYVQFGASYKRVDHFRERFIDALKIAVAVYRDADIDIDPKGVLLRPSRAPVAPRIHALSGPARVQQECCPAGRSRRSPDAPRWPIDL